MTPTLPPDTPEWWPDNVDAQHGDFEFDHLCRNVSDEPLGGGVWVAPDEHLTVMRYNHKDQTRLSVAPTKIEDGMLTVYESEAEERWFDETKTALRYAVRYMEGEPDVLTSGRSSTTQMRF